MALIDAIASLATPGPYTVTRQAPGSYSQGRYTPGATSTFQIIACIQPVPTLTQSGRILMDLPEGQHADELRIVYTITELRTRHPTHEPDKIILDGEIYSVIQVARWQGFGDSHYKVWVSRRETP